MAEKNKYIHELGNIHSLYLLEKTNKLEKVIIKFLIETQHMIHMVLENF